MSKSIFLFLLVISCQKLTAQYNWGEASPSLFEVKSCSFDTAANAMVLYDKQSIYFKYEEGDFYTYYSRYKRTQVLKKAGFDEGNMNIYYYSKSNIESIMSIDAQTLNIDEKKSIKATKVNAKSIFYEKESDVMSVAKIVYPDVRVGAILEVSYVIRSKSIRFLNDWYFQSSIPSLKSVLKIKIPSFFEYTSLLRGKIPLSSNTSNSVYEKWPSHLLGLQNDGTGLAEVGCIESVYTIDNLPAMYKEGFVGNIKDYYTRMEFYLSKVKMPYQAERTYSDSWDEIANELNKSGSFGLLLGSGNGAQAKAAKAIAGEVTGSKIDLTRAIFKDLQTKVKWNGIERLYPNGNLAKTYSGGVGNSADLNMLLVDMLREAGIKADPLLLRSKSLGKIQKLLPEFSQFNHVIAFVEIDSTKLYLDATNKFLPMGAPAPNSLNYYGFRLAPGKGEWIDIIPISNANTSIVSKVSLSSEGVTMSKSQIQASDYEAVPLRVALNREESEKVVVEKEFSVDPSFSLGVCSSSNVEDPYSKLKINAEAISIAKSDMTSVVYVNPFPVRIRTENPFKLKDRTYPICFSYPFSESVKVSFEIPEGYNVVEMPKSVEQRTEDGSLFFRLVVERIDKYIQFNGTLTVDKAEYSPEWYEAIKSIYGKSIDAYNSLIVLEKAK
jgi:hypothetical protein